MNEPIDYAQKTTGKVTAKQVLACIRAGGDSLYLHGVAAYDRASYSDAFIFTMSSVHKTRRREGEGRPVETTTKLEIPGYVSNGRTSERETRQGGVGFGPYTEFTGVFKPLKGFWSLTGGENTVIRDVLEVLPGDAEIAFRVALDYGTHEYLVRADIPMNHETFHGLHADHLYLVATYTVRGKRKTREYLIDTQIIPHNTARFGEPGSRVC